MGLFISLPLWSQADLILTQEADVETVAAGGNLTYTITVSNNGPADADGVVVTDTLPAGTTFVASEGCIEDPGGQPDCGLGTLPMGAMSTFTLTVAVPQDAVGTLTNVAEAEASTGDPNPGNNDATLVTGIDLESDLGVLISDAPDPVVASGTVTYTVQVVNNGPSDARGVQVTDALPEGVVIASSNGCDEDPNASPTCSLGDLAAGDSTTYNLDVRVDAGTVGELANTVTVSSLATDPNADNNSAAQTTTAFAEADLDVSLSASPDTVVAGEEMVYTVFVENNGPSDATNVVASMLLPPGVTLVSTSGCDEDPQAFPACTLGNLGVGATAFYQLTVQVASSTLGTVTNQVFVTNDATDPDSGNNEATFDATVISEADLVVSKTDGVTSAVPGESLNYTIEVRNAGPSDATEVDVIDPFPVPLDCIWQCSPEEGASCFTGQVRADLIDTIALPAGTGVVYSAVCTIDPAATGTLANTVRVTYPGIDPDLLDNVASDLDTVLTGRADLRLSKTDGISLTAPGQVVTYTIVVSNDGPSDAFGSRVVDALPGELQNVSWTCSSSVGSSCTTTGTGDLDDTVNLASGGQITYLVSGTVADDAIGFLINTARVDTAESVSDPNLNNNEATDFDTEITDVQADLRVSKTDQVVTATPGGSVTYTMVVTNDGPQAVDDARIQDSFPAELSCIWSCEPSAGASCTPGQIAGDIDHLLDLPAGGSVTYTAACQIAPDAAGSLSNTVFVTPPSGVLDPDLIDNSASDLDTELSGRADLRISKTDGTTLTAPGQSLTYTLQIFNDGPSAAVGARVQDTFNAFVTDVTWTCTGTGTSSCNSAGSGDIDELIAVQAGEWVTFVATGTVAPEATGTLLNTATVAAPEGTDDPNSNNNTAVDFDTVVTDVLADLTLSKTDNVTAAVPGGSVTYVVVVGNDGPNDVLGATLEDVFAPELDCIWSCAASGGAQCAAGQVAGDIQQPLNLPVGTSATFEAVCAIDASASGTLTNTATVTAPPGAVDPNLLNNSASDLDTVLGGRADLAITKTDNLTVTSPGEVIRYQIVVRNDGPSDVSGAVVQDTFPADLEDISWTCTAGGGGSCPAGGTDSIDVQVALPSGASLVFQASARVSEGATGNLENTATVTAPEGLVDPDLNNNTAIDFDTAISDQRADLSVTKTDNATSAVPGGTVTYDIVVANDGPADVTGARVGDVFPSSMSCLWTCAAVDGAQCTAGQVAGNIDHPVNLPVGGSVTFTALCSLDGDAAGTLRNTASITAPPEIFDPNLLNNSAADLDTVLQSPQVDLSLQLDDGTTTAVPGTALTYTLTVRHEPVLFALVEVEREHQIWRLDTTRGAVSLVQSLTASSCQRLQLVGSGVPEVDCSSPGASSALHPLRPEALGLFFSRDALGGASLERWQRHSGCPEQGHCELTPVALPSLPLQLPDGIDAHTEAPRLLDLRFASPGGSLAGVQVRSPLSPALSCQWTCQSSLGSSCSPGPVVGDLLDTVNIAGGGLLTYTAQCQLESGAVGLLGGTILIQEAELLLPSGIDDVDTSNNGAEDSDTLTPRGDLQILKDDGRTTAAPGEGITYTVQVHNPGPSDAVRAQVLDDLSTLPLDGVSWTCTASLGSVCSAAGVLTLDDTVDIAADGTLTFLIQGTIQGDAVGTLINRASVNPPDGFTDPIANNNTALDFDTQIAPRADLAISLSDGLTEAIPGMPLTYTATVANGGPSDVSSASVQDFLPDTLKDVTWTCQATPGSSCTASGDGDVQDSVDLRAAGLLTYRITGTVKPDARGTLSNTASVTAPFGTVDPNPTDNQAGDLDTELTPRVNVTLTKSDGVDSAVPGETVTYTIQAINAGPSDALGAQVDDAFSDEVACLWTCAGSGGGVCTPGQATGDIQDTVTLPVGAQITYSAVCTIDGGARGALRNTATFTPGSDTIDVVPGDNTSSDLDTVLTPHADLAIETSDGVTSATPGEALSYTVTVSNFGPGDVLGARVQTVLPTVFQDPLWICQGSQGGACVGAGAGTLDELVDLPAGSQVVFQISATLDAGAIGTLTQSAHVEPPADVTDPESANNSANDTDTILAPSADLSLSKTDGVTSALPGGEVTYTLEVHNGGPSDIAGATVTDTFPADLTCRWTCQAEGGALCAAGQQTGHVADSVALPVGTRALYTAVCAIASAATGTLANTASVTLPDGSEDPHPVNNTDSDLDTALVPQADLHISKTDGVTEATPGGSVTYTIVVANPGPSHVVGAQVTDLFAAQLDCSWTCLAAGGGSCQSGPVSGHLVDTVDLPVNAQLVYSAQCAIDPSASGTLTNTATVEPPPGTGDPEPGNNSATDGDTILTPSADLTVSLTDGVQTAVPGTSLTYTLAIGNDGPNAVFGARVEDIFPAGLQCLWGCVGSGGAQCTPGQVSGDLLDTADVPVGGVATYTADCQIDPSATGTNGAGTLSNTATVSTPPGVVEIDPSDNTASDLDTTLTPVADLVLAKSDGAVEATPGGDITYRVEVSNPDGPSTVDGAQVRDTPPASLQCSWTCSGSFGGQCSTGPQLGDLLDAAVLPPGGRVIYEGMCAIDPLATGTLSNSATVTLPVGADDPDPGNNSATDDDTVLVPQVDLTVGLDNGVSSSVPGSDVSYTLTVRNELPLFALLEANTGPLLLRLGDTGVEMHPLSPVDGLVEDCHGLSRGNDGLLRTVCGSETGDEGLWVLPSSTDRVLAASPDPEWPLESLVDDLSDETAFHPTSGIEHQLSLEAGGLRLAALGSTDGEQAGRFWALPPAVVDGSRVVGLTFAQLANVQGAQVLSQLPEELQCSWTCDGAGDASCTAGPVDGDVQDTVDLGVSGQLTYALDCSVASSAEGTLTLRAEVVPPTDVVEVDPSNNSIGDVDVLTPTADLVISKTDGVTSAEPGAGVTYTIEASNADGPSDIRSAQMSDLFPNALSCVWTCAGLMGGRCTPGQEAGDIVDTVDLPVGSRVTYTADCLIDPGAVGTLSNTAQISLPAGAQDPVLSNNSASDLDTQLVPSADLSISKTDGVTSVAPGGEVTYSLTVRHLGGSSDMLGARVEDLFAASLDCLWTCSPSGGASCSSGQVAGDIIDVVDLPIGSQILYQAVCQVEPDAVGTLTNTASVSPPAGASDPDLGNNSASDTDTVLSPTADLSVQKSNGTDTVGPGQPVVYDITVSNGGPSHLDDVSVTDIPPDMLEECRWTCHADPGASCTTGPVFGDLQDTPQLSAGTQVTYTLECTLADDASGQLLNSADVAAPEGTLDPNLNNNTSTDLDTVFLEDADLVLSKTADVNPAAPGGEIVYTLRAGNPDGPFDQAEVRLLDAPPAALTCQWNCLGLGGATCPEESISGDLDALMFLPVGGQVIYEGVCRIDPEARGTLSNSARLVLPVGGSDPDLSNNEAEVSVMLQPTADLQLSKSDGQTVAVPGSNLTYVIELANPGPSALFGVEVSDPFPPGLSCSWSCVEATVGTECDTEGGDGDLSDTVDLSVGAEVTYNAVCFVDDDLAGTLVNIFTVNSEAGVFSARDDDTVLRSTADLSITKDDGVTNATPGSSVTYTLVVRNDAGPSAIAGAVVEDDFPSATSCTWSCQPGDGATCASGNQTGDLFDSVDLPIGAGVVYTAVCQIDSGAGGNLINTATVTVPPGAQDPNLGNNTATDVDSLGRSHDLALIKSGDPASVFPGGDLTYTLTVSNGGPSNATSISLTDNLPDGVILLASSSLGFAGSSSFGMLFRDGFESGTLSAWGTGGGPPPPPGDSCSVDGDNVVSCDLGGLPAGSTGTVTLQTRVEAGVTGTLINQATVGAFGDPNSSNNTSTASTEVGSGDTDVGIVLSDDPDPVTAGNDLFYTLEVMNHGPAVATGVTAVDNLPPQVSLVSATSEVGICGNDVGAVTCELGELAVGDTVQIALRVSVDAGATSALTNNVNVSADQPDPNPINDVDFETTSVQSAEGGLIFHPMDGPRLGKERPNPPGVGSDGEPVEIPVLSHWGLLLLAFSLGLLALGRIRPTQGETTAPMPTGRKQT